MNVTMLYTAFQSMSRAKKISFSSAVGFLAITTVALLVWFLKPEYATLFSHLDNQDAQLLIQKLEENNLPYRVSHSGSQIYVLKSEVGKTRLMLMNGKTPISGKVGFELFDHSDFGMTDFSQKINYLRALQGELERTITSLDEIQNARVHLVIPEKHLFERNELPSAGVTLKLNPGITLSTKQVNAIQHLIAASVSQLKPEQITVIDERGNALSRTDADDSEAHLQAKRQMENYLQEKALKMLAAVYPKQPIQVSVDINLNYDKLEKQSENYVPISDGVITHIRQIKHEKGLKKQENASDSTIEKTMQYGRVIEKQQLAQGVIKHLSVGVIIPKDSSKEMLQQIENIVKNAIGYDPLRGDTISVAALGLQGPVKSVVPQIPTTSHTQYHSYQPVGIYIGLTLLVFTILSLWQYDVQRKRRLLRQLIALMEKSDDKRY